VRRALTTLLIVLAVLLAVSVTSPEARREMQLKKTDPGARAKGTVGITYASRGVENILMEILVWHLEPNSLYSVWVVDTKSGERNPGGSPGENYFKTDPSGNSHYSEYMNEWSLHLKKLEIALHPDGDINNTADMKVVLYTILLT
jgi:hypothetical protein